MKQINIVCPCFNEEGCIEPFYNELQPYIQDPKFSFQFVFVDDGSGDGTLDVMKKMHKEHNNVQYISFSRNFGKEAAMKAGLDYSKNADAVIMMDADLQHPPYIVKDMIENYKEGYEVVYTRQRSRKKESFFKRSWAKLFYAVFNKYSDVSLEQSTKDFMLIDKKVVKAFVDMPDSFRFTKGILSFVGFKRCCLEFDYIEREQGTTKWNFTKLLKYGVSGLNQYSTIFKIVPVIVGFLSFLVAIMSLVFFLTGIMDVNSFIVLLSISILIAATNMSVYFMFLVLYSTRNEVIKRPQYLVEEDTYNEETVESDQN